MLKIIYSVVALLISMIALQACSTSVTSKFRDQLANVCIELNNDFEDSKTKIAEDNYEAQLDLVVEQSQANRERMKDLKPPQDLKVGFDKYLDAVDSIVTRSKAMRINAMRANFDDDAQRQLNKSFETLDNIAKNDLKVPECGSE